MVKWLGMPLELRNPTCERLVNCWTEQSPSAFAAAFKAYLSKVETIPNAEEVQRIERAADGDLTAMETLWTQFISSAVEFSVRRDNKEQKGRRRGRIEKGGGPISDPKVQKILEQARNEDKTDRYTIYDELYSYLEKQVDSCKRKFLYTGQQSAASADLRQLADPDAEVILTAALSSTVNVRQTVDPNGRVIVTAALTAASASPVSSGDFQNEWQNLADTIRGSAERIWRDLFLSPQDDFNYVPPRNTLEKLTRISRLLMLLWLETVLYQDRAYSNQTGREAASGQSARVEIRRRVRSYHRLLKQWDNELAAFKSKYHVKTYFVLHQLESQQFRRLTRQFADLNPEELGWASQVTDAEAELWYQQRDALRRQYWANGRRITSVVLLGLRITTGYGTRPGYFAITALVVWAADALLFWLNDFFNHGIVSSEFFTHGIFSQHILAAQHYCVQSQPHISQWWDVIGEILRYLYIAITNLTSLGSNSALATYCNGVYSEVVVLISTGLGYFMLGLLSAMIYAQLTHRD